MKLIESLTYSPVELGFGTSGLRGLLTDMTDLECYINVMGFLRFLRKNDGLKDGDTIFLAGDLRSSTPRIMQAMVAAAETSNCVVVNGGKIPTPAIAYYALIHDAPCIMVTGSHIPADRNGIKFYKSAGEIMKSDEYAMQACVATSRREIYDQSTEDSLFARDGSMKTSAVVPGVNSHIEQTYLERYTSLFNATCFKGKQIIVYQHSAVGRDLLVTLFEKLGAEVVAVERSTSFIPIDTENVTEEDKRLFEDISRRYPGAFAIVSTDGDSDRPFVIDETGVFYRGDVLGCIVTQYLGLQFAAVPVSANDAAVTFCGALGVPLVQTKIGSPYVIAAMNTADTSLSPRGSWEVNGGFLLGTDVKIGSGSLRALPTRDAVLPILAALLSAIDQNLTISALFAKLPSRYTGGGLIDDIAEGKIAKYRTVASDQSKMGRLAQAVFTDSPLGSITALNITDGLRMTFTNGDVVHLRPSGNAPQFRVYTNSDTQIRADELVEEAIRQEGGYIEQLLTALMQAGV
jgi:phosphomannomutase